MDNSAVFPTMLAYTKSPQTTRRTTFQEELEKAVSSRAKILKSQNSYSDDCEEDDDFLARLLKTQKQKKEKFKSGKTKGKINDFKLSDDEEENKPKNVSFIKTRRSGSPEQSEQVDNPNGSSPHLSHSSSISISHTPEKQQDSRSEKVSPECSELMEDPQPKPVMSMRRASSPVVRKSLSETPLPLNSENSQWEPSLPVTSEASLWDSLQTESGALEKEEDNQQVLSDEERPVPQPRERSFKPTLPIDVSPRPKPRQKTVNAYDSGQSQTETPACSGAATSSMSIAFSSSEKSQMSDSEAVQSPDEEQIKSEAAKTQPLLPEQEFEAPGSVMSRPELERSDSVSLESENNVPERTSTAASKMSSSRPLSSQSSGSRRDESSEKAESKYLGRLKILDQRITGCESVPLQADSLRAAVYQDWVKKKEESLKVTLKAKKEEEKMKEEKKKEETRTKVSDGKASYEAWLEKKRDVFRKKLKEEQEKIKLQTTKLQQKEEQKEAAKQAFEKWKQERDDVHKERIQEKRQKEKRQKLKKVMEEEERMKDCKSAFSKWSKLKQDLIDEKVKEEQKEKEIKEVEDRYEKEEREQLALEKYDKWLRRKEFQQTKVKKEMRILAILQDEPPPPWSPPNKTIPFGK